MLLLYCILILIHQSHQMGDISAQYGTLYNGTTYNNGSLASYKFNASSNDVARVWVSSDNATALAPLLTVVTERRSVLSWQVPFQTGDKKYSYKSVARTLCPYSPSNGNETDSGFISVALSSQSTEPVQYQLNVTLIPQFTLRFFFFETENLRCDFYCSMDHTYRLNSTPSEPQVHHFVFPENVDSVLVVVTAWDRICMIISLQPVHCPMYDLDNNVVYTGEYQTVTTKGAIPITRNTLKSNEFYIVIVVKPSDESCTQFADLSPPRPISGNVRRKDMEIRIEQNISRLEFNISVIITLGVCAGFYLMAVILGCAFTVQDMKEMAKQELRLFSSPILIDETGDRDERELLTGDDPGPSSPLSLQPPINYGSLDAQCSGDLAASERNQRKIINLAKEGGGSSEDETNSNEFDHLDDMDENKAVIRSKTKLTVQDLSRKSWKQRDKKYRLYQWNLLTISVFYTLPVIQLVLTYQAVVYNAGNQDICYYNFLCARPFGPLFAFNTIFSNIGYVLLGALFLILVKNRQIFHQKQFERQPALETEYGVPRHYGLFYAMGIALIMEGVMSACYHVCPNYANFQFDTAFMYMIGALGMLKLYQIRHPDINANSHVAYATMACVILLSVIGVLWNNLVFWVLFSMFYIVLLLLISLEFYYKGEWHIGKAMISGLRQQWASISVLNFWRPAFPDRLIFIFLWNLLNMAFVGVGLAKRPKDFPSFLVAVFVANLLLYSMYYICMKLKHGERFRLRPLTYVFLASASWAASLYFFFNTTTSWRQTPALSRELNRPCVLLDFYDSHDIWHFLSALSLFLSYLVILNFDDDLDFTPRKLIAVF